MFQTKLPTNALYNVALPEKRFKKSAEYLVSEKEIVPAWDLRLRMCEEEPATCESARRAKCLNLRQRGLSHVINLFRSTLLIHCNTRALVAKPKQSWRFNLISRSIKTSQDEMKTNSICSLKNVEQGSPDQVFLSLVEREAEKETGGRYSVVWQATRPTFADQE